MKSEMCYIKDFGYEKFETVVGMVGGKWRVKNNLHACFL